MAPPPEPVPHPPASFPSTVLVVDDEEVVRDVLGRALSRRQLPFELASSGEEAIAHLKARRFGCVITDKNLPDLGGVEVLREARALQPHCARIMITGYTTPESILEVLRLGASDYLEKPFNDMKLVLQRIEAAIEHQRTEFERDTLVEVLRAMQAQLRERDAKLFQQGTELDLVQSVVELRVEEATAELAARLSLLEADRLAQREQAARARHLLEESRRKLGERLEVATGDEQGKAVLRDVLARLAEARAALER